MDVNKDGQVSITEFFDRNPSMGGVRSSITYSKLDLNQDGVITWPEFFGYLMREKLIDVETVIRGLVEAEEERTREAKAERRRNFGIGVAALSLAAASLVVTMKRK